MIFNLSQGGVAYLSVTAPSGAAITASCLGLDVTGTGTCTLEVPIIGTWHIVCVFDNTKKTADVSVEAYGETYTATFDYAAKITVTTFPGADVTATKTGMTALTGTAGSDGICVLTVPEGCLGEWSVEADNGSVTETTTVNVAAYDIDYPISLLTLVPDITVVIGDDTYNYKGVEITNTNLTISPVGLTGWKLWMKASGTVTFNVLPTNVDICIVGHGGGGGICRFDGAKVYCGGGGSAGMVINGSYTLTVGQAYSVTVSDDAPYTQFGSVASASIGGGSSGGGGGGTTPEGGPWLPGGGNDGHYAFDDQTFDGIKYGKGGQGGFPGYYGGGTGARDPNPGAGGGGGGQSGSGSSSPSSGLKGIVILRNAS